MNTILRKTFYAVSLLGILFSLALLVLLTGQLVVSHDVNDSSQGTTKWIVVPCCLIVQICFLAPYLAGRFCINRATHQNKPDYFKPPSCLPKDAQDEERLRKWRESNVNLLWGIAMILFYTVLQCDVVGLLSALFPKDNGMMAMTVSVIFVLIMCPLFLLNLSKLTKKPDKNVVEQEV